MLTGRQTFPGEDVTEVLAAVVRGEPDWNLLPATLLHAVEALRRDPVILASLSGDAEIGKYYADAKEEEFLSWHNQVSDWEIRTYLTSI